MKNFIINAKANNRKSAAKIITIIDSVVNWMLAFFILIV